MLIGRIHVLSLSGRHAEAARLAARAGRILARAGETALLGKLHMNRGNAFYQQDRYREAHRAYARADALLARAGTEEPLRAGLLMNRAVVSTQLERLDEARRGFLRCQELAESLGQEVLAAYARYNRAFLEAGRGDFRTALRLLERAGSVFTGGDAHDMTAATDQARAEIYLELGMGDEAVDLARAAATAFTRENMAPDAVLARLTEARGRLRSGRPDLALPLLQEALAAFGAGGNRPRRAQTLLHLAEAELAAGRSGPALDAAGKALAGFRRLGLTRWVVRALDLSARCHLARGRPRDAEARLAPALRRAAALPLAERRAIWTTAGRAARAVGRTRTARARLERAASLVEAGRRLVPGVELRTRSFEEGATIYHELLALELDRRRPRFERLFALTERVRGRGFRDLVLRGPAAAGGQRDRRRVLLGALTRRLEEAELGGPAGESGPGEAAGFRRRILDLERELLRDRRRRVEKRGPALADLPAGDPDRIARGLAPDEVIVSYLVTGGRVLALVLGADRRRAVLLPVPAAETEARIRHARFQLESAVLAGLRPGVNLAFLRRSAEASLAAVHEAILAPLAPELPPAGRLHVIPHRFLHHAPLECLHDGTDYLESRLAVDRLALAEAPAPRRTLGRRLPGPPLVAGTLRDGPAEVEAEVEAVARALGRRRARVMRDPVTSELLEAMEDASWIHLSAHGVFREDNPAFSAVRTGDGALFLDDVLHRRLRASVVVLSACNTGHVMNGGGEDLSGVAHGFLASGAGALLAGLWRIHDAATRRLMTAFYSRVPRTPGGAETWDPGPALLAARRRTRADFDHPGFWGSFALYRARIGGGRSGAAGSQRTGR